MRSTRQNEWKRKRVSEQRVIPKEKSSQSLEPTRGRQTSVNSAVDWSQLPRLSVSERMNCTRPTRFSGTAIRYRLEGKWFTGRVKQSTGETVTINSNWTILAGRPTSALGCRIRRCRTEREGQAPGALIWVERVGAYAVRRMLPSRIIQN